MPSRDNLTEFTAWCGQHITGDENGQVQILPGANPLKDAHAALDTAVLTAYGFSAKKDLLAQLLALNQQVAAKIEKGEPVMPPGVPKNYPDAKKLVTEDCIKPVSEKA